MSAHSLRQLNALALLGIAGILAYAFFDQFAFGDLPCPLCLLQRVGFTLAGFGFALNLFFGSRPSHYGIAILGALAGAAVAARQILLHIVPGTGTYGEALFGLHFYTWAFIAFVLIILGASLLLFFEKQFRHEEAETPGGGGWRTASGLGRLALGAFALLVAANALATFAECGLGPCPDDPQSYQLLGG